MAEQHQRTPSTESCGLAFQLILDHVLSHPTSYEIPLRNMYSINSRVAVSPPCSTPSSTPPSFDGSSSQSLSDTLMAQMAQIPTQPASLPPSFITTFVQRCFPPELTRVDFPHALAALDYLKDLEGRRRREVGAAMGRLHIDRAALENPDATLSTRRPAVARWVRSIEERERKIESLYTRLWIGLRRWILINELSLQPFSKSNCVAMLNTLYPPIHRSQPTSKLTPGVLREQRNGFFKYIGSVETHGPSVLRNLMQQGKSPSDETGWPALTRIINMYLQLATCTINECAEVLDEGDIAPRKADSGVSFNSFHSTNSSSSAAAAAVSTMKPESIVTATTTPSTTPPQRSPMEFPPPRPKTPSGASSFVARPGTALEKIAKGLKTIGRGRGIAATEMIFNEVLPSLPSTPISTAPPSPTRTTAERPKGLKKMRSMGSLSARQPPTDPAILATQFECEQMRRRRLRYEAELACEEKFGFKSRQEQAVPTETVVGYGDEEGQMI